MTFVVLCAFVVCFWVGWFDGVSLGQLSLGFVAAGIWVCTLIVLGGVLGLVLPIGFVRHAVTLFLFCWLGMCL